MHTQTDSERDTIRDDLQFIEKFERSDILLDVGQYNFIDLMRSILRRGYQISPKERAQLKRIWQEVTNKGVSA